MFRSSNSKVVPGKLLVLDKVFKFPIVLIMPFIAKGKEKEEKKSAIQLNPE